MNTGKLKSLIEQAESIQTQIAGIDADEERFDKERADLVAGGDYSSAVVGKITEIDTRLSIIPAARNRLQGQREAAAKALADEIHALRSEFITAVHEAAERQTAVVAEALKPFAAPETAKRLAAQTEIMAAIRDDQNAVGCIGGDLREDLPDHAKRLLSMWETFSAKGRLSRPEDEAAAAPQSEAAPVNA